MNQQGASLSAAARPLARVDFGRGSTSPPTDSHGLSFPESGFVWTVGAESGFTIPLPAPPEPDAEWLVELVVSPYLAPPALPQQRLEIWFGATCLAEAILSEGATFAIALPREIAAADTFAQIEAEGLAFRLRHVDATSPATLGRSSDARALGFQLFRARLLCVPASPQVAQMVLPPLPSLLRADLSALPDEVRAQTGLSATDLMMQLESLGHNCEFGIAQRRAGAEPLGLLRFAFISGTDLVRGLERGFAGVAAPESLVIYDGPGEYPELYARQTEYVINFHTQRYRHRDDEAAVRAEMLRNLAFYQRKFLETIETGDKLFVVHSGSRGLSEPQARAILLALRAHGPNALLYVVTGDQAHGGEVRRLAPGFYRGLLPSFAPLDRVLRGTNLPCWLSLAANAYSLWCQDRAGSIV